MTVQEIQEIGFEKAVFGGYDMKSVDTFLERVAEEFATTQKENAALKAKMKVLVDKIEEYRGVEDGMRRALMSAQSIAQETVDKAKAEAEQIVAAAKNETENKVKSSQGEIALEEQKLKTARKYTSDFIYRVSAVYQAQAKALADLAKAETLVREQPAKAPAQQQTQSLDQQVGQQVSNIIEDETAAEKGDEPVAEATRRIPMPEKNFDFGELKFGNDYDPKDVK